MKLLSLFIVISIFSQLLWATDLIEVNSKENADFQESAFIKIMNSQNGGKIPYPFSDLLDSFGTGVREEGNILFVPKGRSLVKESADYRNPRIIVNPLSLGIKSKDISTIPGDEFTTQRTLHTSAEGKIWDENRKKFDKMGIGSSDIYIGLAPNHKALEVISYNPKKPGFDFFVVEDYEAGKTPRIVSNPALCLSCHQNEAPIFPRAPWTEILGESSKDFNSPRPLFDNQMMDLVRNANPDRKEIEGIDLDHEQKRFDISQAAFFDSLVRVSNTTISDLKRCEALCSDRNSIKCQQDLIKIVKGKEQDFTKSLYFKDVEKNINNIDLKSSVIPDRDPQTNVGRANVFSEEKLLKADHDPADSWIRGILEETYGKQANYDVTYDEGPFSGEMINIKDNSFINPATVRPLNSNISETKIKIAQIKDLNEKIKYVAELCLPRELDKIPSENVTEELLNRPAVVKALKYWPETGFIVSAINKEIEKDKNPSVNEMVNCIGERTTAIPVYKYSDLEKVVTKFNDDKIKKPQALFQQYCIQCHGGEKAFIPLPLESMEGMATYVPKFGDKAVRERLEKNIMPPAYAKQPSQEDRAEMIKVIKELSK